MLNEITTVNTSLKASNLEDLYNRFLKYTDAMPKTIDTYRKAINQFLLYLQENGISQPVREDVLNFKTELLKEHKPTTVQNYIMAVRQFFNWTEVEGLYPNIAKHVKGAKIDRSFKKDYFTGNQIKHILSTIDRSTLQGKRDYAIISLMVTGGLRTIEVARANIEDIRTVGGYTVLFIEGKGREEKAEYIKLMPEVETAIREYLATRKNAKGEEALFTSTSNRSLDGRLSTRTVSEIAKSHFLKAGYNSERLTAHSLRHTAVTLALMNGRTLQEAQQFARHSNIATTQIYAHNLERINNQCENTIASAIF